MESESLEAAGQGVDTEVRLKASAPLKAGARVRVTHLRDMYNYDGGPVDFPAGDVVQGTVTLVERDGFFQLDTDCGEIRGYFAHDPTLRIEALERETWIWRRAD